jgi:hypothetical protein
MFKQNPEGNVIITQVSGEKFLGRGNGREKPLFGRRDGEERVRSKQNRGHML